MRNGELPSHTTGSDQPSAHGTPADAERIPSAFGRCPLPAQVAVPALAAAAAACNRQDDLAAIVRYGIGHGVPLHYLYEALLQVYLFAGFPAALEGLGTFSAVIGESGVSYTAEQPEPYDPAVFIRRGEELCRAVYTTAYDRMRERVGRLSPDLDLWMVVEGYGKTLSRPGLPVLIRELAIVAVLGVLGWRNQLHSHIRGAANVGAGRGDCEAVLDLADRVIGLSPLARAADTLQRVFT